MGHRPSEIFDEGPAREERAGAISTKYLDGFRGLAIQEIGPRTPLYLPFRRAVSTNPTFAGRSASRRMKYGIHWVPKDT